MKTIFSFLAATLLIASVSMAATAEQELTTLLKETKKANTDVVLVYKDGQIIYQYYAREYGPNTKHLSWSMAKTITGILIGIAESEGLLSIDDPVSKYFPGARTKARILDVLNMSSGIKFKEAFEGFPTDLDLTEMMYLKGQPKGYVNYMLTNPLSDAGAPGEYFNYSSGDTDLLMGILQKAINNQSVYNKYPWEKFFKPLGIDATFEQDVKGTFVGASYIYMKATDFLKVGRLLMKKGNWKGKQIIPVKYFELMNKVADGVHKKIQIGNEVNKAYSMQVTTNLPIEGRNLPSAYNDLPLDALIMYGHQGQIIAASPSQNLVMVKLAMDKKVLNRHSFFAGVRKVIEAKGLPYEPVGAYQKRGLATSALEEPPYVEEDRERGLIGTLLSAPNLMRAYMVKEYCSCRLVVGRSEKACKDDMRATSPILPKLKIKDDGTVTATLGLGLFKKSKAYYRGKTFGCTLTESE
jgi:CubicO group peptidase (beta-lactamase class C family)